MRLNKLNESIFDRDSDKMDIFDYITVVEEYDDGIFAYVFGMPDFETVRKWMKDNDVKYTADVSDSASEAKGDIVYAVNILDIDKFNDAAYTSVTLEEIEREASKNDPVTWDKAWTEMKVDILEMGDKKFAVDYDSEKVYAIVG